MSKVLDELKAKAAQLPHPEHVELALTLLESLDAGQDEGVQEAWDLEITRRMADIERGEAVLVPAEEVLSRLRRRVS